MSEMNLFLMQWVCIIVFWAGLRFAILKRPPGISLWVGSICMGVYAGHGIVISMLLFKDISVLSRINWSSFQTIQSIACIIVLLCVLYAGGMLILKIVALTLHALLKFIYGH